MTATAVWHFSKSFCKNEVRLSSQVRIRPRLRGKSTCLHRQFQHERDRATPLPRWSFPEAAASVAFAIVTENDDGTHTVRRSEDWRRSHHNATTQTCGRLRHRRVDDLVLAAMHKRGVRDLHVWCHYDESAYLVHHPSQLAMMVFLTELNPTLWMNHVLLFGTTGQCGSMGESQITYCVLDGCFCESSDTASSALDGFGELIELVGCRMKGATKAHSAHSLNLLGVQLHVSTDVAVIAPAAKRKTKLANFSSKHIDAGKLSSSDVGSFAGKAGFFNTTGLGYAGRAAMKPSLHDNMQSCISGRPLRKHLSRRSKHYTASRCMHVHELFRCPRLIIPSRWFVQMLIFSSAGFGSTPLISATTRCRSDQKVSQTSRMVHMLSTKSFTRRQKFTRLTVALPYVLKWLAPRGPFIFMLEAIVQLLALFVFHDKLREPYLSFIVNTGHILR